VQKSLEDKIAAGVENKSSLQALLHILKDRYVKAGSKGDFAAAAGRDEDEYSTRAYDKEFENYLKKVIEVGKQEIRDALIVIEQIKRKSPYSVSICGCGKFNC